MAIEDGAQEIVVIFDREGSKIEREMTLGAFQDVLARRESLASHAASQVRAVYAQVGSGLAVRALVFFLFKVDEDGQVDSSFNLPLQYLAGNAGLGPDLGLGRVRMASRGQCPVPWHAINLWEPVASGDVHPGLLVQKAVWRNRLALKTVPVTRARRGAAEAQDTRRQAHVAVQRLDEALQVEARDRLAPELSISHSVETRLAVGMGAADTRHRGSSRPAGRRRAASADGAPVASGPPVTPGARVTPAPPTDEFRAEMQRQQQGYLEQIKGLRDEIQRLKSSLRHERERNRRLQQLLRGEV
jgi:hypothetical protein